MPGTPQRLKIIDFGVACPLKMAPGQAIDDLGTVVGTAHYMAPEQAMLGAVDGRADLYAVGMVLKELIGYAGLAELPVPVRACVEALVAAQPADRPSSAQVAKRLLLAAEANAQAATPSAGVTGVPRSLARQASGMAPTVVGPAGRKGRAGRDTLPDRDLRPSALFDGEQWLSTAPDTLVTPVRVARLLEVARSVHPLVKCEDLGKMLADTVGPTARRVRLGPKVWVAVGVHPEPATALACEVARIDAVMAGLFGESVRLACGSLPPSVTLEPLLSGSATTLPSELLTLLLDVGVPHAVVSAVFAKN